MALIKLGPEITEIYGRFGGVYFKRGPDGQHIQAMPRIWHYPQSPAQLGEWGEGSPFGSGGIKGFSGASALWMLALLGFFGALWTAWALANLFMTDRGEEKHITGYNWYIHYAMRFPEAERPPFWKPPHAINDLPAFIITYRDTWMYAHDPTEWPVSCPGDYYWRGTEFNGKPFYKNDDLTWYIWWDNTNWIVSEGVDYKGVGMTFVSGGADIVDYYQNPVSKRYSHVYFGNPEERLLPH